MLPAEIPILAVGGIMPESLPGWIEAGASGFGIGSALYTPGRDAAEVRRRAEAFVGAWQAGKEA